MYDLHWPAFFDWPDDAHDIEPHRVVFQVVRPQERLGGAGYTALLLGGDRFGGGTGPLVAAGLHLDEHHPAFGRTLVDRDEVELAEPVPLAREEDPVALAPQQPGGKTLAPLSEWSRAAQ